MDYFEVGMASLLKNFLEANASMEVSLKAFTNFILHGDSGEAKQTDQVCSLASCLLCWMSLSYDRDTDSGIYLNGEG